MSTARLDELLRHPAVWRADTAGVARRVVSSGFRRLDEHLPGGGWPLDTLVELLVPSYGVGELNLILPALRALDSDLAGSRRWIAWLGPPHMPYAPALASAGLEPGRMLVVRPRALKAAAHPDAFPPSEPVPRSSTLWAMEQALRSRACAAALGWVDAADGNALRRLKLAAEEGGSFGVLFRPARHSTEPSPAALRLLLEPNGRGLDVVILKCQGGMPGRVEGVMGRVSREP